MSRLKCLRPKLAPPQAQTGWKPDSQRGNSTQRGYDRQWRNLRQRVMERDMGLCQECKRSGLTTMGAEVDHITPKAEGGRDNIENLQLLCVPCHAAKTLRESNRP